MFISFIDADFHIMSHCDILGKHLDTDFFQYSPVLPLTDLKCGHVLGFLCPRAV